MQMLGHDGPPAGIYTRNLVTNEPLARCPLRSIQLAREADPAVSADVDLHAEVLYPAYLDGHLLAAGGIADQPNRYLEMMRLIGDFKSAAEIAHYRITKENA